MKRLFALLLTALLLLPIATLGQKSMGKLKKGLAEVKKTKRTIEKKLDETKHGIQDVKGQMETLEVRLQKVSNQLEDTTEQLSASKAKQAKLKVELDKANAIVAEKKTQVEKRIRVIYKQGKPNVLEFAFGSKSAADLSTREFIARRVELADRQIFAEFRAVRESAKKKKEEQDAEVRKVEHLLVEHDAKQQELESAQKKKEEYLQTLNSKKGDLEVILDELDSDAANIEGEIRAAVARAEALEAKKMEAARKKGERYRPPPKHSGGLSRPTGGSITSRFGSRFHPILKYTRMHSGIDFGGGYGAPVFAAAGGTVISAGSKGSYGSTVVIDHGGGFSTVYGHLSRISVSDGQTVSSGQRVGSIGSSGLSTGPHLHFEVRINGRAVDPMRFL
jgi:murein DD-endopeptidase MepM/ murein hydrolase activator NlpD